MCVWGGGGGGGGGFICYDWFCLAQNWVITFAFIPFQGVHEVVDSGVSMADIEFNTVHQLAQGVR